MDARALLIIGSFSVLISYGFYCITEALKLLWYPRCDICNRTLKYNKDDDSWLCKSCGLTIKYIDSDDYDDKRRDMDDE